MPSHNDIDGIVIACCRKDYWLACIAAASVRYYYPQIPLYLLKDEAVGWFDTSELETTLDVRLWPMARKVWGNPCVKFELYTNGPEGRYLYIDSDICLIGPVLDQFKEVTSDFIISPNWVDSVGHPHVSECYYDFDKLHEYDPDFQFPGYVFNAGQFVFRPGLISMSEIEKIWDLEGVPRSKNSFFLLTDQGGTNYLLPKLAAEGVLSLEQIDFKIFASTKNPDFTKLTPEDVAEGKFPKLVHWAGNKGVTCRHFTGGWMLAFFEDQYYKHLKRGAFIKQRRKLYRWLLYLPKRAKILLKMRAAKLLKPFR